MSLLRELSAHHTTLENLPPNDLQILLYFSKREIVENELFDLRGQILILSDFMLLEHIAE